MTLYYRDDSVQVTSEMIWSNGTTVRVADVTYVWHARGRSSARVRSRLLVRGGVVFLLSVPPLVALVCVVSLLYAAQDRHRWGLVIAILAIGAAASLAMIPFLEFPLGWLDRSYSRGGGVQELWIQTRGTEILLLRTSDAQRFGQVYRAVQRVVEHRTDPR
ncbi:DUF6232 family protein [Plantactinospora sp. KBS50]|uniref:DUF6232 family protein n=1 Tax=Plantactinospora sp. KBS50 TaxID=2024580 RepID=UPI000BAAE373|nr:DUF6232 family protein [Plantactinospora sp. KBS50]ASW53914.1 hypothetical protein CIK06_06560 [Plantactinospora sp. KBS50]